MLSALQRAKLTTQHILETSSRQLATMTDTSKYLLNHTMLRGKWWLAPSAHKHCTDLVRLSM